MLAMEDNGQDSVSSAVGILAAAALFHEWEQTEYAKPKITSKPGFRSKRYASLA